MNSTTLPATDFEQKLQELKKYCYNMQSKVDASMIESEIDYEEYIEKTLTIVEMQIIGKMAISSMLPSVPFNSVYKAPTLN